MHKKIQLDLFDDIKNKEISFTKLSIFLRCPLEYWHRFVEKDIDYDPRGKDIFQGRLLHKIAEDYLKLLSSERSLEILTNKYLSHINKYRINKDDLIKAIDSLDKGFLKGLKNPKVELPFKTSISKYIFKGRADCLACDDDGLVLIDFKKEESDLDHLSGLVDRYLQLIFYYYGLELGSQGKYKTIKIGYYFLMNGKVEYISPTRELLQEGLSRIIEVDTLISSVPSYTSRVTKFCLSCMVGQKGICTDFLKKEGK